MMNSVDADRPFRLKYVKPRRPPLSTLSQKENEWPYWGWLCTVDARNSEVQWGWPGKKDHERNIADFRRFFPDLVAWCENEPKVRLRMSEGVTVCESPVTVIGVQGTLAGMRRFEAAWSVFVTRFMPFFAKSNEPNRLRCMSFHWTNNMIKNAEEFFPHAVAWNRGLSRVLTKRISCGEMIGPVWDVREDCCRFHDLRDAVYVKLALENEP